MWRVIHTQKVQRYDHYNSIAALKRWVDNVITAEHVCVCVCVCALYRRRQRHCWPLIQAGLLFLLYHTNVCTSHTDWVSWEITADRTPGLRFTLRKLYFIENSSQLVLDCPPAHGEASIPTSCYVCLLLAKAVLSWANPAIIFHQGLEARGVGWGGGSSVCYSYLGSPALYGWGEGNHCYTWKPEAHWLGNSTQGRRRRERSGMRHSGGHRHARVSMHACAHTHRHIHSWTQAHMHTETWHGIHKVLQDSVSLTSNSSAEICCHSAMFYIIQTHTEERIHLKHIQAHNIILNKTKNTQYVW